MVEGNRARVLFDRRDGQGFLKVLTEDFLKQAAVAGLGDDGGCNATVKDDGWRVGLSDSILKESFVV